MAEPTEIWNSKMKPSSEHSEYISRARQKVIKELEEANHEHDRSCESIPELTIKVRAILATNSDIFARIIESIGYDSDKGSVFTRYGFETVQVKHIQSMIHFSTYSESSDMAFDLQPLKTVPDALGLLAPIRKTDFGSFIDYESFVDRALAVLHEDVVGPFLVKLKDHLEKVQVCLGEVDQWLLDSYSNQKFLETLFDKNLDAYGGADSEVYMSNTGEPLVSGRNLANELCVHCNNHFNWHKCVFINGYYYRRCINPPNQHSLKRFYSYRKEQVLKECVENGRFEAVFNISEASEQARLVKFLEFMSC